MAVLRGPRASTIGYYIHHRGAGHLHRAQAIAEALPRPVTGLSSLPQPTGWPGQWIQLPLDTDPSVPVDPTAGGTLHWAPVGSTGLLSRMSSIAAWLAEAGPACMVVDVSVEVALLARLHGIPVITMGQPGDRRDAAHTLGYTVSAAILAPWPSSAQPLMKEAGPEPIAVGAISRIPVAEEKPRTGRRVATLRGHGNVGSSPLDAAVAALRALPGWEVVDAIGGRDDIASSLLDARVVLSHCGQNAVAEIAATRSPAILLPEDRPHGEQRGLARALLDTGMPALVLDSAELPTPDDQAAWTSLVEQAARLEGAAWQGWCDGAGAARAADAILAVAQAREAGP